MTLRVLVTDPRDHLPLPGAARGLDERVERDRLEPERGAGDLGGPAGAQQRRGPERREPAVAQCRAEPLGLQDARGAERRVAPAEDPPGRVVRRLAVTGEHYRDGQQQRRRSRRCKRRVSHSNWLRTGINTTATGCRGPPSPGRRTRSEMPLTSLKEILDPAFDERYGVAAINIVNDLSIEAVLAAATELESPVILQTSLKTVKQIGARVLYELVARARRGDAGPGRAAPRPLPRARVGHDLPADRLELGAVRRLAPRHRGEHPPDGGGGRGGARVRRARRGRDRERAWASRTTSAPTRRARSIRSRSRASSSRTTGVYAFAPAVGTAHGLYAGEPNLTPERVTELVALQPIPMVLHGGTGLSPDQFQDCIGRGCAKVNISTALKIAFVDAHREYLDANPDQARPAVAVRARARRGHGDGGRAHPAVRLRRQGRDRRAGAAP